MNKEFIWIEFNTSENGEQLVSYLSTSKIHEFLSKWFGDYMADFNIWNNWASVGDIYKIDPFVVIVKL